MYSEGSHLVEKADVYKILVENIKDYAIFLIDPSGCITSWNKGAEKITGFTTKEVLSKHINFLYTEEDIRKSIPVNNLLKAKQYGQFETESLNLKKDGKLFCAGTTFASLYNDAGSVYGYAVIARDISEKKRDEEKIFSLAHLIEKTREPIFSTDTNFKIKTWNSAAENLYGYNCAEVAGKPLPEIVRPQTHPDIFLKIDASIVRQGFWTGEMLHLKKDGTPLPVYESISLVKDNNDYVSGYVWVVRDITEQRKQEAEIKKMQEQIALLTKQELDKSLKETADYKYALDEASIISITDRKGIINHVNNNFSQVSKYNYQELIGKDHSIVNSGFHAKSFMRNLWITITSGGIWKGEIKNKAKDGTFYWSDTTIVPFLNESGHPYQYLAIHTDITERKKAEEAIIQSEKKYKLLFEDNPLPMWMFDLPDKKVIDVNNATLNHYGYTKEEFLKLSLLDLRPKEDIPMFIESTKKAASELRNAGIWRHIKKDGTIINVEIFRHDIVYKNRPARLVLANDVTENFHAQEKLRSSHAALRELAAHLQDIREEERATIAREIHDELGQQVTGLKMDVSWMAKRISPEDENLQQKMQSVLTLLDETVQTVRKIATDLRPSILDDLGLIDALNWYSSEFEKRFSITVHFKSNVELIQLQKRISVGIFRIYQEALTNIARHARATLVETSIRIENNTLNLNVTDNGTGFDISQTGSKKTLGLLGMKERTIMMDGNYEINSEPGNGTTVNISVPL